MESIIRNVRDISAGDRHALEHVLGQSLTENQQVIFNVVSVPTAPPVAILSTEATLAVLPDWCQVNDGLTEEDLERLDRATVQRLDLTRS